MTEYISDANGRLSITVNNKDGSSIVVYQQGAHVASWKNSTGEDLLYLSPSAVFTDRVPIRGGVPVIFPQFGNRGPLTPSHGFARLRPWKLVRTDDGVAVFTLHVPMQDLSVDTTDMPATPTNAVQLTYVVEFSNTRLNLVMKVNNLSDESPASFHFAYHTYFPTSRDTTVVNGLNLSPYIDNRKGAAAGIMRPQPVWTLQEEFDRVFPNQKCAIMLQDLTKPYMVHIASPNLPDAVVWNPGEELCVKFKDLPTDAYKHFICVEHGAIMKKHIVQPGSTWIGTQEITILSGTPTGSKM